MKFKFSIMFHMKKHSVLIDRFSEYGFLSAIFALKKYILSNLKISWFSFFSAVQWTMNLSVKNSIAFHFQLCRSFIWQRQPHFRRNYCEVFSPHYPWLQSIRRPVLAKVSKCMEKVKFSSFYSLNIFKCTRFQINGL